MEIGKQIVDAATENGATLAGIASMKALKVSASHMIYNKMDHYAGIGTVKDDDAIAGSHLFNWPDSVRSVLVVDLSHPEDKPELDWWDGKGTPGNRVLLDIIKRTSQQIESNLSLKTHKLHYYVEKGGVFLKDAAVLAGFGCIGKNNMVLTPSHGPRIRLRALFIDADIDPTGPITFAPCSDCKRYCRRACPENALDEKAPIVESIEFPDSLPGGDGFYDREICNIRMEKDVNESRKRSMGIQSPIKYCRKCELICPVGKKSRTQKSI
ncbi:MAG: epoxyqueuosine reductase [Desulfobacterales bacterium]|nr:epoxyqueuosine reductase [Desulfobacterales bacterium]